MMERRQSNLPAKGGKLRTPPNEITRLLRRWSQGDHAALNQLMPIVLRELHKLAGARQDDEALSWRIPALRLRPCRPTGGGQEHRGLQNSGRQTPEQQF